MAKKNCQKLRLMVFEGERETASRLLIILGIRLDVSPYLSPLPNIALLSVPSAGSGDFLRPLITTHRRNERGAL